MFLNVVCVSYFRESFEVIGERPLDVKSWWLAYIPSPPTTVVAVTFEVNQAVSLGQSSFSASLSFYLSISQGKNPPRRPA